jgi:thioredoxin-like negative regulator of GroEL
VTDVQSTPTSVRPQLLFFSSPRDGYARRVDGFLAQVLQRRKNHESFTIRRIDTDARPDLAERFRVGAGPTLIVVDDRKLRGRLNRPTSCSEISELLQPWLR